MKFGIVFANTGPFVDPVGAVELARAAEAAGFESLWTVEHTVVPAGYESTYPYDRSGRMPGADDAPIPDPLVWLAFLASATTTINLATGILIQPQRNPVVLAKEVATLDHLSDGRLLLGRRRRMARGGVRRHRHPLCRARPSHRRRDRRHAGAVESGPGHLPRRVHLVHRLHLPSPSGPRHGAGAHRRAHRGGGASGRADR